MKGKKPSLLAISLLIFLIFLPSFDIKAGEFCGSKEGFFHTLASTHIIPEYFPPKSFVLASLLSKTDLNRCHDSGLAYLGEACKTHDVCYERQAPKSDCDKTLQIHWQKACTQAYGRLELDSMICRVACLAFVGIAGKAQRYDKNGFCPSCEAYSPQKN